MWKRHANPLALVVAVLLVTAACSTSGATTPDESATQDDHATEEADHDEASGDADRVVQVELTEFAFAADGLAFTPGETIEFIITNSGVVEHEFRLSNQDRVDEHIAGGHDDHDDSAMTDEEMAAMDDAAADHDDEEADHDDAEAGHGAEDTVLVLAAGETGTLVFTFPDNDHDFTAIVCLIPGHYEAGMTADISYDA